MSGYFLLVSPQLIEIFIFLKMNYFQSCCAERLNWNTVCMVSSMVPFASCPSKVLWVSVEFYRIHTRLGGQKTHASGPAPLQYDFVPVSLFLGPSFPNHWQNEGLSRMSLKSLPSLPFHSLV
jgi:hypothetical protein